MKNLVTGLATTMALPDVQQLFDSKMKVQNPKVDNLAPARGAKVKLP